MSYEQFIFLNGHILHRKKKKRAHIHCAGLIIPWETIFPYFRLSVYFLVLLQHVCPVAPSPHHYTICPRQEEDGAFCSCTEACIQVIWGWWEGTAGHRGPIPLLKFILLRLCSLKSKALFHLGLDAILFSLVIPISRCFRQNCSDLYFRIVAFLTLYDWCPCKTETFGHSSVYAHLSKHTHTENAM